MPFSCPHCAAQMPETAAFCPGCGRPIQTPPRAQGTVGIFPENIAGALAYFTFIPAIAFLLVEPYGKNRFVRFHSVQCLLLWGAALVLGAVLKIAGWTLLIIPVVGHLFFFLICVVVGLAELVIWLVLVVKAFQGEAFKLPVIGDWAERQASAP